MVDKESCSQLGDQFFLRIQFRTETGFLAQSVETTHMARAVRQLMEERTVKLGNARVLCKFRHGDAVACRAVERTITALEDELDAGAMEIVLDDLISCDVRRKMLSRRGILCIARLDKETNLRVRSIFHKNGTDARFCFIFVYCVKGAVRMQLPINMPAPIFPRSRMPLMEGQSGAGREADHFALQITYFGDNLEAILLAMKGEGFVFGGEQPLSRKSYNTLMKHIEKKIDLHDATPHVLRHTYLTMAAGENIDSKTLQSMAGHGSYDMTMDTYVHPKKENVAKAGQMMDALFGSYAEAV